MSPFDSPRYLEVDTETIELIFSILAIIWLKLLSIEYSYLFEVAPTLTKNTSEEDNVVLIPIVSLDLVVT